MASTWWAAVPPDTVIRTRILRLRAMTALILRNIVVIRMRNGATEEEKDMAPENVIIIRKREEEAKMRIESCV